MAGLRFFLKSIDKLGEWTCKISSLTLMLLIGVVIYEVVLRRVFRTSVAWTSQVSWMLWTFISVMSLAWTQLKGEHIAIDVMTRHLSPRMRAALDLICYAFLCFFFLTYMLLLWIDQTVWRFKLVFPPPMSFIMAAITVGIGLLLLQCLAKFIRDLVFVITGRQV